MIKIFKKLLRRKNKKYYEASERITNKEKRQLFIFFSVVLTPIVIALGILFIT